MNRTSRWLVGFAGFLALGWAIPQGLWAQGYANPQTNPRYATPREGNTAGPAQNGTPANGPKPRPTQPIQLVGGEEPIRQPGGPVVPRGPVAGPVAPRGPIAGPEAPRGPIAGPVDPRQVRPINNPPENAQLPGNGAGGRPPENAPIVPPAWIPLDPQHANHIDQILDFWERTSDTIEQYKCKFVRWEFDPIFGPQDLKTAKVISEGVIQYAKPDKGLFRVDKVSNYTPPAAEGKKPSYTEAKDAIGEHWVCDGIHIFEFDSKDKQVIERTLPPEMQGKAITEGPLPFLFGAKAAEIKARYWLRAVTPKDSVAEYWLEAVPKTQQDAANFQKVLVIIDQKDFLPKAIDVFTPNFDKSKVHTAYSFDKREVWGKKSEFQQSLDKLRLFHAEFYAPKTPFGWKRVKDDSLAGPPAEGPLKNPPGKQATRPTTLPK